MTDCQDSRDRGTGPRAPRRVRWLWPLTGLAATAWFLVRCVPKPSRAAYPCQRAAFPIASSFVLWALGMAGATAAFRHAGRSLRRARVAVGLGLVVAGLAAAAVSVATWPTADASAGFTPTDPPNTPMGVGRGIHRGCVAWVHDPDATDETWVCPNPNDLSVGPYWWEDAHNDQAAIDAMVADAVCWLTGEADPADAWDALFRHSNVDRGRGDVGYTLGERVFIKPNHVEHRHHEDQPGDLDNRADLTPQVLYAVLKQLVRVAGVPEDCITVCDSSRYIADKAYRLCAEGVPPGAAVPDPTYPAFPGVHYEETPYYGSEPGMGGDTRVRCTPTAADRVFFSRDGKTARLPQRLVDAEYLVNLTVAKVHEMAGVTACAKNHYGSLCASPGDDGVRLHDYLPCFRSTMGQYAALVDLMGHEDLGGKTILHLVDMLWSAPKQSGRGSAPVPWALPPFSGDYPSSLLASQDPVAIDSVALDFVRAEFASKITSCADDHLHEAAQADAPPSGTVYDPEDDGTPLVSLGVHEHWSNDTDKLYTRDLGTGDGIELVRTPPVVNLPPEVTLIAPADGATRCHGSAVTLEAEASDPDGTVVAVTFYAGGEAVGLDDTPGDGFTCPWSGFGFGPHDLAAVAADDAGAETVSEPVAVEVCLGGDCTRDGTVDTADYFRLAAHWFGPGGWDEGDFTGDGVVDTADYFILSEHWYETVAASAPE